MMTLTATEIENRPYVELRAELKKRGLHANGKTIELRARLLKHVVEQRKSDDAVGKSRRTSGQYKASIHSALEPLVCPFSLELPIDPVYDSKGRIYERSEIEKYIKLKEDAGEVLISPLTREKIDDRLVPALHVYNVIETLIKENKIDTDLAKSWLERVKQREDEKKRRENEKKSLQVLRSKAEAGDTEAMYYLGVAFDQGGMGLPKDVIRAAFWYKKSSDLGDPRGMALYGYRLLYGVGGVTKNTGIGLFLLKRAASGGSDYACYDLGCCYLYGAHGFDETQAKYYLKKVVDGSCRYTHLDSSFIDEAKLLLATEF